MSRAKFGNNQPPVPTDAKFSVFAFRIRASVTTAHIFNQFGS